MDDTLTRDIAALKARIERLDPQMRLIMEPLLLFQLLQIEEARDREP